MLNLYYVPLQSTRRKSINLIMPKSDHKAALLAIEKVLMLLRSLQRWKARTKMASNISWKWRSRTLRTDIGQPVCWF